MRRVAKQHNAPTLRPWIAANGQHAANRIRVKVGVKRGHQWQRVAVVALKVRAAICGARNFRKASTSAVRPKQRARERAIWIWQRDHHGSAARPNVQRVWIHGKWRVLAACHRLNLHFFVAVTKPLLRIIKALIFLHDAAQRAVRAVCANN